MRTTHTGKLKFWLKLDNEFTSGLSSGYTLDRILNDNNFIRVKKELCCNCIEVNKHYKSKINNHMIYNCGGAGKTFKTLVNKDNICKFCNHYAFYNEVDNNGCGVEIL